MSRIVSVWLPRWPILRTLAAQTKQTQAARPPTEKLIAPDRPFVLAVAAAGGPHIAALNEAAEVLGLTVGEPLADARAKAGFLQVRAVDPAADDAALRRLTLWATRYTPTASPYDEASGADGFFLDVEGASHLFGGEQKLAADLAARLKNNFGLPARIAIADTAGAAWAASRFHAQNPCILAPARQAEVLAPLPVEALRLAPDISATLRRLGFKTVGALLDKPRAPFAARFSAQLLRRLDQALGRRDEPLVPIVPPPVYHSLRYLLEPIVTQDAVVALASRLMGTLSHVLVRDDVGARALKLSLYRVDGEVKTLDIALTLPTRSVAHVARMIALKLDAAAATDDAGFGFEAIGLAVTRAEPMPARQTELNVDPHPEVLGRRPSFEGRSFEGHLRWPPQDEDEQCAALIDALRQRLGPASVQRFESVESHSPERAEKLSPITKEDIQSPPLKGQKAGEPTRPLLLLPHAEPTEVTALVPDGPPRRFCWRGMTYEVAGAEGPERIGAEWWRAHHREPEPTRDYYLVEDADGHRFWLFREGLYGRETAMPRWFVHGLFA
jgi:protein ImuB